MSETEMRAGKAKEVVFSQGVSFAQKMLHLTELGYDVTEADENRNYLANGRLCIVNDRIFEILEEKEYDYEDVADATKNPDGTISYILKYYNGGTHRDEMLEMAIAKMERSDEISEETKRNLKEKS